MTGFSKLCLFCFGRVKAKSTKEIILLNIYRDREMRTNRDGAIACLGNIYSEMGYSAVFAFKAKNSGFSVTNRH